jgi:hypothetical protein
LATSGDTLKHDWLRRLLKKTTPLPYVVWMAGLSITTWPVIFLVWAMNPNPFTDVLAILLFIACIAGLMGLFAAKMVTDRWLATFGDVTAPGSPSQAKPDPKKRPALIAGFAVALVTLIVLFTYGLVLR